MLRSLNHSLNHEDVESIFLSHKFNDHNLRQMDVKEQLRQKLAAVAVNRVHRTALGLAALRYKLGQYDAALQAVLEGIRIAQNKNDYETILECTIWLYQISGVLGNRQQEKQLIEHVIYQANKMHKVYIFIMALLNYASMPDSKAMLIRQLKISPKILSVFREFKIHSSGGAPLWNDLLRAAEMKMLLSTQKLTNLDLLSQLKNHLGMVHVSSWSEIGSHFMSTNALIQLLRIQGPKAL